MKKILLTILILVIVACLFTACGSAPTIEISEDGYWVINGEKTDAKVENPQCLQFLPLDDGTYAVAVGDAKYLSNIVIPATYKGKAVSTIDKNGFEGCTNLKSIKIPDSVTSIGEAAFYDCRSLTSVTIPNSVKSIGDWTFYYCNSLRSIKYRGTSSQWSAISKGSFWDYNTGNYTITYNYTGE